MLTLTCSDNFIPKLIFNWYGSFDIEEEKGKNKKYPEWIRINIRM